MVHDDLISFIDFVRDAIANLLDNVDELLEEVGVLLNNFICAIIYFIATYMSTAQHVFFMVSQSREAQMTLLALITRSVIQIVDHVLTVLLDQLENATEIYGRFSQIRSVVGNLLNEANIMADDVLDNYRRAYTYMRRSWWNMIDIIQEYLTNIEFECPERGI